jgi:hypothetical protein
MYTKKINIAIEKQLLYLKNEYMNTVFRIIPKAKPKTLFLKSSVEKSSIVCSKNPCFSFSLKGGRL